ncbi:MAG: Rieske (2Fe-2S) protein, partial [Gemmatimonadetes bacterium]|nr:Rieske (2Fe-2S) protein [Gemmatimonadota bacterium]
MSEGRASGPGDAPRADRRGFLRLVTFAAGSVAALAAAVPFAGFILAPLRRRDAEVWRDIGAADGFAVGTTTRVTYPDPEPDPWSGVTVRNAAWLRREGPESFTAFSVFCTHTGCPVRWLEDAELFLCPCHGGAFDRSGGVASGP